MMVAVEVVNGIVIDTIKTTTTCIDREAEMAICRQISNSNSINSRHQIVIRAEAGEISSNSLSLININNNLINSNSIDLLQVVNSNTTEEGKDLLHLIMADISNNSSREDIGVVVAAATMEAVFMVREKVRHHISSKGEVLLQT